MPRVRFGLVHLFNSVLASSTGGTDLANTGGAVDGANNLVMSSTGAVAAGVVTQTGDPLLGPLQDNGGPTFTMAPARGGPTFNAGDNASAAGATDQRGSGFPRFSGTRR